MAQAEIGIIGGSGLYSMPGFTNVHEERVETPFGEPSDPFVLGELEGRKVAFLARHGRGHRILPSELNFRANIYAFKKLGVERILSVSAVGSLKEEHKPTDFVIPDQFIDRTFHRISTFFGDGIVGHVAFGDPVCATVAKAAEQGCSAVGVVGKLGGTYVCMEGPQFSTKAESNLYRSWGADVIGMTNLQEAKLAREAEICYATVAMVTDYDAGAKATTPSPSKKSSPCCTRTPKTPAKSSRPPSLRCLLTAPAPAPQPRATPFSPSPTPSPQHPKKS